MQSFPTPVPLLLLLITIVSAASDFAECCTRVPVPDDLKPYQWTACHSVYNRSETYPLRLFAPPILATLRWCQQNCQYDGIFQISETSQWLTPFASWVIPAAAMLFLCPIQEHLLPPTSTFSGWRLWLNEFVFNWLDAVVGYVEILGDPTSAINGALVHMVNDVTLVACLKRPKNKLRERTLIVAVLLTGQADIETPIVRATFQILSGLDKAREYSKTACRTMLSARKKFHMSITLPVIFYIAVAAAIFHDALEKLGDNDTSHSLAYGIWYNWILLLSIFSNCSASHMSLESIRSSLELILRGVVENHTWAETENMGWDRALGPARPLYDLAASSLLTKTTIPLPSPCVNEGPRPTKYQGTIEVKALSLADRYFNALKWNKFLFDRGADVCRPTRGIWQYMRFWPDYWSRPRPIVRYALCQTFAWTFVFFPCLCAAAVSYTTPNVGLGCRSFNHLLYAALSLTTAMVRVQRCFLCPNKYPRWSATVKWGYLLLLWVNSVGVLIGGTVLQLVGVYRTCWCTAGLWAGPDEIVNLATNGFVEQFWARMIWVNVGILVYGWVVVVALAALAVRLYISSAIREALDI